MYSRGYMQKRVMMRSLNTLGVVTYVFIVATTTKGQKLPECFEEGECTQSLYVVDWRAEDAQTCLELCRDYLDCDFFTFYGDQEECYGFANCEVFLTDTCSNCYSGASTCEDLQCWVRGQCQGVLITQDLVETGNECLDYCQAQEDCKWFTFNTQDSACHLLQDCQTFDNSCDTCLSGQVQCTHRQDYTKLIVIGGSSVDGSELSDVEVIDLENPYSTCSLIPDYPDNDGGMAVGFFNWTIKACGNIDDFDSCFDYDPSTNSWTTSASLLYQRQAPRASFIDEAWLVSGDNEVPSDTVTDMWNGEGFIQGPTLPEPMLYHCQLTVNSSHVFFANPSDGATFILNWVTQDWTILPSMSYTRTYPSCGMIQNPDNGLEAVVVGDGTSEIFNFRDLNWRTGPEMPFNTEQAGQAQLFDTFLLVGGGPLKPRSIYEFDRLNYGWILKTQRLQKSRIWYPGVIAVPSDFVYCA